MNIPSLSAPAHWQHIEFISDVHLQESENANFLAWCAYLKNTQADAVFILGDLFELWVGDDVLAAHESQAFEDRCCQALHELSKRCPVYFMAGNRDFLIGQQFLAASGMQALQDPTAFEFGGQRYLLTHGDALCVADTEYQVFRQQVRTAAWQAEFLAKPLQERLALGRSMRAQSQMRQQSQTSYADVDVSTLQAWMQVAHCQHTIHGHTHEGVSHTLVGGMRHVLSDWHVNHRPPRGDTLRLALQTGQVQLQRLTVA